ncbi:MYCBP-associated protein [Amphibalanus amphitrite]|uniref:MYCBP-associated protein n=1 Tax=Amphibalanus amphitrite TaxID=1232801 RepID=A0A6A4WID9_AMPAM|nr:MYCBP-associated protein [Amphibalanus amphitrite]
MTESESMLFLPVRELSAVQPHQILGTPAQLYAEAERRQLGQFPGLTPPAAAPPAETLLRPVSPSEYWHSEPDDPPVEGDRALAAWQRTLLDRRRQERALAGRTQRPPQQLVMHSGGDFQQRCARQLRRSLPHGPAAARPPGTAFWRLPSRFGGELHGLLETLTEERCRQRPRADEQLHVASVIRAERGTEPLTGAETSARAGRYHRQCRPAEPPEPADLVVLGRPVPREGDGPAPADDSRATSPEPQSETESCQSATAADGPRLLLAGHEAVFRRTASARTAPAVRAAVSLSAAPGRLCRRYVPLAAAGSTAIHYSWRSVDSHRASFTGRSAPPVFFFDPGAGVLLPGAVTHLPVVFCAPTSGLYSAAWDLVTRPRLEGGAPLRLLLYGLAGLQDPYGPDRRLLQRQLEQGVARAAAEYVLAVLVRRATLSEEVPPAPQPANTLETRFRSANVGLQFDVDVVHQLDQLHHDVAIARDPPEIRKPVGRGRARARARARSAAPPPPPPWDLSCDSLKRSILSLEGGPAQQLLLGQAPTSAATLVRTGLVAVIQRFCDAACDLELRLGVNRGAGAVTAAAEPAEPPAAGSPQQSSAGSKRTSRSNTDRRSGKKRGSSKKTVDDGGGRTQPLTGRGRHRLQPQVRLSRGLYGIMRALLADFLEDITEPLEAVARPPDEFLITDGMCGPGRR